jgi:hypothetical protein
VDAEAARGTGGVVGAAWGAVEGMGVARGATKVDEARDEGSGGRTASHCSAVV